MTKHNPRNDVIIDNLRSLPNSDHDPLIVSIIEPTLDHLHRAHRLFMMINREDWIRITKGRDLGHNQWRPSLELEIQ